jgi:hypothetical protein
MTTTATPATVQRDYLVTPESVATAGAISYWRLSGAINLARLSAAWGTQSLDPKLLPTPPGDEVALGRAVRDQAERRRLVRPLEKRGAWAIVAETAKDDRIDFKTLARVYYDKPEGSEIGTPRFVREEATSDMYEALVTNIRGAYERHRGELESNDISGWLVKLGYRLDVVALRDTGGIYFVPRQNVDIWRRVVAAIESVSSHRVFKIPALRNSEAIEAITEAVTAEAVAIVDRLEAELALTGDDALGDRALKTRAAECSALLSKVNGYEALLESRLVVAERVLALQGTLAAATLMQGDDIE